MTTKKRSDARQVNQYDKIFRENMEAALPGLIKRILCIEVTESLELPDDIQHTKERKPDVLKRVTDQEGETFVLHIEFQATDEDEMAYRMAEYLIMLSRKYKLPVRQYVIYIGETRICKMKDHLELKQLSFRYDLVALMDMDYHVLLRSDNVEEKILAILGDFGKESPKDVVQNIVNQVVEKGEAGLSLERHLQQLRVLANLRKLVLENIDYMDSIAKYIKKERDVLYRLGEREGMEKGMEKGIEKGEIGAKRAIVKRLLADDKYSAEEIAGIADVTEAFVNNVRNV